MHLRPLGHTDTLCGNTTDAWTHVIASTTCPVCLDTPTTTLTVQEATR